jgi:hypothetical protein
METNRTDYGLDVVTVLLLAVATLATSWATYQATRWSGQQAAAYNQANARRVDSGRAAELASGQQLADVVLFTNWLGAYAADNARLEEFYRRRFRPEFKAAFDPWLQSRPGLDPKAAPTPFALPEYRLAEREHADRLEREADGLFQAGQSANQYGDNYVLDSVVLAGVLFFAGISQQLHRRSMRVLMVAFAVLLCMAGLAALLRLPVA